MSDFVLYNYFRSSTSFRVRIALNLKGIGFEYRPVHLLKDGGEQHLESYRALNPQSGVPTLVHGSRALGQSMAILEYLDQVHPEPRLFPKDPFLAAQVRQVCEAVNADMHAYSNLRTLQYLEKKLNLTESQRTEWIHHWMRLGFEGLEQLLSKHSGTYCFGDQVTAADVLVVPHVVTADRFKFDLSPYPRVLAVSKNGLKHPAFEKAHPFRQIDTPSELRIP